MLTDVRNRTDTGEVEISVRVERGDVRSVNQSWSSGAVTLNMSRTQAEELSRALAEVLAEVC